MKPNLIRWHHLWHSAPLLRQHAVVLGLAVSLVSASAQTNHAGNPLRIPPAWTGGVLTAAPTTNEVWPGSPTPLLAINGSVPSPTIRVQKDQNFTAVIQNRLSNDLVLHWHGIVAPPKMDGHPNDAVPPGQNYSVDFPIRQRAGTYFYHPHTEPLTGSLVYQGLAGAFIVEDPAEQSLGLPAGDHDSVLLLQDKRLRDDRQIVYEPSTTDSMMGYLGDTVLVNGTPDAYLSVDKSLYRLRLINGSNARVYKLGFSDGRPFRLIATDGGLLAAPVPVTSAFLAPGERVEILVDFSTNEIGTSVVLRSLEFDPASMAPMGGTSNQMDQMNCMAGTNMMGSGMGDMTSTNGMMTMSCAGMMTMMAGTNTMGSGMEGTNAMGQVTFTGTMTCMSDTNMMGGGTGEMGATNGMGTMSCTGMMTMMDGTNTMGSGTAGTNALGQISVTGTMTCMSGTNMVGTGSGDTMSTNGMITMSFTGMMSMMADTNVMGTGMNGTNVTGQMSFTGMMTFMSGTNIMGSGTGDMRSTNAMGMTSCTGMITMMAGTNSVAGTGMRGTNSDSMMAGSGMTSMMTNSTMMGDSSTGHMGMMDASATGGMALPASADTMGTNAVGGMSLVSTQGVAMDILRFFVDREGSGAGTVPSSLSSFSAYDPARARRTRTFTLAMDGMTHTINGGTFTRDRVDFQVPYGELEIWEFRNTTDEIHPMHPHGALFQVLDRNGNANLPPENLGWKDTVLVWPQETVRVLIRFDAYPGLYVSHCHNLEHEDGGMMQNLTVLPMRLAIKHQAGQLAFDFPATTTNYVLEVSTSLRPGATWTPVPQTPTINGDTGMFSMSHPTGIRFYRLKRIEQNTGSPTGGDPHAGHH